MNAPLSVSLEAQLEQHRNAVERGKHKSAREEWLTWELDKLYDDDTSPREMKAPCGCVSIKATDPEDGYVSRKWKDCEEAE